jgi:hypothetical protein
MPAAIDINFLPDLESSFFLLIISYTINKLAFELREAGASFQCSVYSIQFLLNDTLTSLKFKV